MKKSRVLLLENFWFRNKYEIVADIQNRFWGIPIHGQQKIHEVMMRIRSATKSNEILCESIYDNG